MTCFLFSSFKTLLTGTEDIPHARVNVPTTLSLAGFQVTIIGRFWVTTEVYGSLLDADPLSYLVGSSREISTDEEFVD